MASALDQILQHKQKEVQLLIEEEKKDSLNSLELILNKHQKNHHLFKNALKVAGLSIIAEIKRPSPSKKNLAELSDPAELAHTYSKSGAAAISIRTDFEYLGGSIEDLKLVTKALNSLHPCPVLQKDFIIHPYQIALAKKAGASAVLLIVAAVKDRLKEFLDITHHMGLDALVEVQNEKELELALDSKAQIVSVHNVDFEVQKSVDWAQKLGPQIPKEIVKVAESKILTIEDAHILHETGYDGILVREILEKAHDVREVISEMGNV